MCGVFGVLAKDINLNKARCSHKLLSHRGPDSESEFLEKNAGVYIAFHRLAIQDLSILGEQPMISQDKNIIVMLNGEIYNFEKLRNELSTQGYKFKSKSDTEVIIIGYQNWGIESLLKKLDGMFAIVVIDLKLNLTFLCRDQFGIKPMYYNFSKDNLVFASEIKPLLSYTGEIEIDKNNFRNDVFFTSLPISNGTNFKKTKRILAGEYAEYDMKQSKLSHHKYFSLGDLIDEAQYEKNKKTSRRKITKKLKQELAQSISSTLVSDAPVGVLFSGGVDSAIIARFANIVSTTPVKCYSLINKDSKHYISNFRKLFSTEIRTIELNESNTFENLGTLIYGLENINKTESWVLGQVCSLAKKDGVKSLLSGDGADELFAGYREHSNFYLNSKISQNIIFSKLQKLLDNLGFDSSVKLFNSIKPSSPDLISYPVDYVINNGKGIELFNLAFEKYKFEKNLTIRKSNALLFTEINYWIERFLLRADKFSSANSIELRLPYLRADLVKFALNIPFNKKIKFKVNIFNKQLYQSKSILRILGKKIGISNFILRQRKVGTNYTNSATIDSVFKSWNFSDLEEFLDIRIDPSYNLNYPDRLKVSLVCGDIFLKLFVKSDTPESINRRLKLTLKV
jgi:asparagine synthase (glutamine-hydrolysing)